MVGTPRRASRRQLVPDAREEAGGSRRCRETARLLVRPCLPPESSAWPNALRDVASICPLAEQTQPLLPAASPCRASPAEPELHARRWSLQRCAADLTRPTALDLQPATPKQQQHDLTAHHALPHRHPRRVLVLRGVGVTHALSPSPHTSFPQPASCPSCDRPMSAVGWEGCCERPAARRPSSHSRRGRSTHTHLLSRTGAGRARSFLAAPSRGRAPALIHSRIASGRCCCAGFAGYAHGSAPAVAAAAVPPVADAAAAARCPLSSAVCLLLVRPPLVVRA